VPESFRKTAMTEPSSDNSEPDFFHNPEREFIFKLLDAGITHACGSEVFVDNLRECGLLDEYEEILRSSSSDNLQDFQTGIDNGRRRTEV
jgi:hypothetical protein